jgi:hypothetical protein
MGSHFTTWFSGCFPFWWVHEINVYRFSRVYSKLREVCAKDGFFAGTVQRN